MPLPAELVSFAVRGINNQTIEKITAEETLRGCAIHSLQYQAGFIPQQDSHALYTACSYSTGQHIEPESLNHLHKLLNSNSMMLREWIQAVCSVGKTVPDEYIPFLLTLDCEHSYFQPWLKLIMSERAQWLIEHHVNKNWNWYAGCEAGTVDELITAQNNAHWKTVHAIHQALATGPVGNGYHKGLAKLDKYPLMWRQQTARLLIDAMFVANTTGSFNQGSMIVTITYKAAYRLPLNFAEEFLATLRSGHDGWKTIADEIEETFTMRFEMLKTILENSS